MLNSYDDNLSIKFREDYLLKIGELKKTLSPYLKEVTMNKRCKYKIDALYYFDSGVIAVYRDVDGMLLGHLAAPCFFGVTPFYEINSPVHFKCQGDVVASKINYLDLQKVLNSRGREIEHVFIYILISTFSELFRHGLIVTKDGAYKKIRDILLFYSKNKEFLQLELNICSVITKLTGLSRAHVMRLLTDLKNGGYIEIADGKLVKVHRLPRNY